MSSLIVHGDGDGAGDERARKSPKNDEQHREGNREPENLTRKCLGVDGGNPALFEGCSVVPVLVDASCIK